MQEKNAANTKNGSQKECAAILLFASVSQCTSQWDVLRTPPEVFLQETSNNKKMDNQHLTICCPVNVGKLNEFQQNQVPETPELAPFDEEKQ